jgi:hypothetical protein
MQLSALPHAFSQVPLLLVWRTTLVVSPGGFFFSA